MDLVDALTRILLANELGGRRETAYRFSHARRGNSGWSFGLCQWDLGNNRIARSILYECGFDTPDIEALVRGEAPTLAMRTRLETSRAIIDKWDRRNICDTVSHVRTVLHLRLIRVADELAVLALCDYDNQFYFDVNGKMAGHLAMLGRPANAADVFSFALGTKYGQEHPDDLRRRHGNIRRIYEELTQ